MAVTQYTADVGDTVSVSCNHQTGAPPWMTYNGSDTMSGTAKLPSGFTRMRHSDPVFGLSTTGLDVDTAEITVNPVALPADTSSPWRCAVYAPNGSYIVMNGLNGIPTVGTPTVRLSDSAPSKAVVRIPLARGADNVRAPTFAKWSDGHAEMLKRGMEMTVEFRDSDTGLLTMVFRGRIYQMESADSVVVTAYDRLMDLAQFSDQYQPDISKEDTHVSTSKTVSGSNFIYQMDSEVGTITGATEIDKLKFDPLGTFNSVVREGSGTVPTAIDAIAHAIPSVGTVALSQGDRITKVGIKEFNLFGTSNPYTVTVRFTLMRNFAIVHQETVSVTQTGLNYHDIFASVDWVLDGPASEYMLGAELSGAPSLFFRGTTSPHYSDYYHYYNGAWVAGPGTGAYGEIYMEALRAGASISPSSFTASGSTVSIAESSLSPPTASGVMTVEDKGAQMSMQYYTVGGIAVRTVIEELLTAAGLSPQVISEDLGQLTYFSSSTFDYLSCLHELLRAENLGLRDRISSPGVVDVRRRHTIGETPVRYLTTSPSGTGERIVTAHDLTAHWMAEKATVAYITEGTNVLSGYPIAVETDDRLYDDSVAEAVGSPLRQVTVDTSMGTHDAMAKAAGGKMVQLHTNVFEGTVTLAGYRLNLWDLYGSGEGGMPVGINVPEYDAQGTAVPTEMILGDGSTMLTLDNIRTADRSEVANSMNLTNDAISNGSSQLPSVVYIFARTDKAIPVRSAMNTIWTNRTITGITIVDEAGNALSAMTDASFIKMFEDSAGYAHVAALFTPNPQTPYASNPIHSVVVSNILAVEQFILDNPKTVSASQGIHIDIRFEKP